jgi:hypothetical protein
VFHYYQAGTIAARLKRWIRMRKNRIKGERKGHRNQSNDDLRHRNNCCSALFVTNRVTCS